MKLDKLHKRISSLEEASGGRCPRCRASRARAETMSDEEMDRLIANPEAYVGTHDRDLPEPSPGCKECHKYDSWSDAELDVELARFKEIWETVRLHPT
jgi:hypothetical protein